jgi:hypothetical protein
MNIEIEPFNSELFQEIIPLAQECWDECSDIKKDTCAYHGQRGLKISPNYNRYVFLRDHDALVVMTLRDKEKTLRGYAALITYGSLHLEEELCGNIDSFYVQPAYRRCMPRFMSYIEDETRARNVSILGWPVSLAGKMKEILERRGYIADDVIMELKLKDIKEITSCA